MYFFSSIAQMHIATVHMMTRRYYAEAKAHQAAT